MGVIITGSHPFITLMSRAAYHQTTPNKNHHESERRKHKAHQPQTTAIFRSLHHGHYICVGIFLLLLLSARCVIAREHVKKVSLFGIICVVFLTLLILVFMCSNYNYHLMWTVHPLSSSSEMIPSLSFHFL